MHLQSKFKDKDLQAYSTMVAMCTCVGLFNQKPIKQHIHYGFGLHSAYRTTKYRLQNYFFRPACSVTSDFIARA